MLKNSFTLKQNTFFIQVEGFRSQYIGYPNKFNGTTASWYIYVCIVANLDSHLNNLKSLGRKNMIGTYSGNVVS